MKTRELLNCDIKTFSARSQAMKAKELDRHITRIAADLGESNVNALLERVVDAVFAQDGVPESTSEEMRRVLHAVEESILITADNEDQALRLVALCVAFLRQGVKQAAREQRLAARASHDHAHHHHCGDPACTDDRHGHESADDATETALAHGIRSTLS